MYIVRHGQSESNKLGRYGGGDPAITPLGESQARDRAIMLKDVHFDAVFSSDYVRARRTAEILFEERKLAIITKEALRERSWGSLSRKKVEEVRQEIQKLFDLYESLSNREQWTWKGTSDMENLEEAGYRFIRTLREIAVGYGGKRVAIVCHGGLM